MFQNALRNSRSIQDRAKHLQWCTMKSIIWDTIECKWACTNTLCLGIERLKEFPKLCRLNSREWDVRHFQHAAGYATTCRSYELCHIWRPPPDYLMITCRSLGFENYPVPVCGADFPTQIPTLVLHSLQTWCHMFMITLKLLSIFTQLFPLLGSNPLSICEPSFHLAKLLLISTYLC